MSEERASGAGPKAPDPGDAAGAAGGPSEEPAREAPIPVRLTMPDRWLEHVAELPPSTTVEEAKRLGLREMLLRDTDDPDDFYTEYAERRVTDESLTLAELGMQPNEMLAIRAYDLGHYPPFRG